MEPNHERLNAELQDRGFFTRHARERRRSRTVLVVLCIVAALLSLFTGGVWMLVVSFFPEGADPRSLGRPLLVLAGVSSLLTIGCLLGIVIPPIVRRIRARHNHAEFQEGGALWWQADLGIIIDSLHYTSKNAETLALLLPAEVPEEEARKAAQVIGQRIAAGQGTAFMTIDESVVHRGRGWPGDGSAVDHLGYWFAPLRPGRYVAVLPDGAVLGIAQGKALDVSGIVQRHDADRVPPFMGADMEFRMPLMHKVVSVLFCLFASGIITSMARAITSFPVFAVVWFLVLAGLGMSVLVFMLSIAFGRTRIDNDGVHVSRLIWRWSLPWQRVRGFAVRLRRHSHGGGHRVRSSSYTQQIVVVEDSGRTRMLLGMGAYGGGRKRSPEVTGMLCRLDALRRWRQLGSMTG